MNKQLTRRVATIAAATGLIATGATVALATPASADIEKWGSCSQGARYDFDVDYDDGYLESNFEVDSNVRGQKWRMSLHHDGNRVLRAVHTTDYEGEVDFERYRPNTSGSDAFKARAVNLRTGEVCSASIMLR